MSFLLALSDPETLAVALAFIDAFDSAEFASASDASLGCEAVVGNHERARAKRKSAWYSARLRAREKDEVLKLKEQVASLELQLERLKRSRSSAGVSRALPTKSESDEGRALCWLEKAADEVLQRQKAERLNAQLKTLLGRLVENLNVLQGACANLRSLTCNVTSVAYCPESSPMGLSLSCNEATPEIDELWGTLGGMLADTRLVFPSCGATAEEGYNSRIKRDPISGGVSLQLSSITPLEHDLDTASRLLWTGTQIKHDRCYKERVLRLHPSTNSVVKSYVVRVRSQTSERTLHGVTCVRKIDERDRIVHVWTAAIVAPKHDDGETWALRLREKGWIVLSRDPTCPERRSVLQTRFEVSSERGGGNSAGLSEFVGNGTFGRSVVELLGSNMRGLHEQLQNQSGPLAGEA